MSATAADFRRLALALPEAYEDLHRGKPTFRVNARIFAMLGGQFGSARHNDSMFAPLDGMRPVALVKLIRDDQLNLCAAFPAALQETADYPHHGWTHVWLDEIQLSDLETVVRLAWICVAPRRLSRPR
jgi:hypothetical protein